MTEQERALLQSLGFGGWQVVSRSAALRQEKRKNADDEDVTVDVAQPLTYVWTISNGKGQTRQMVVRASSPDDGQTITGFTVVEPPKDAPQGESASGPRSITINTQAPYIEDPKNPGTLIPNKNYTPPAQTAPTEGQTRTVMNGNRLVTETFRGGQWSVTGTQDLPASGSPPEGTTRKTIQGNREVTEVFQNGVWSVSGYSDIQPAGQPQEGQTRSNVVDGQVVQQIYSGGQWVIDTSVPPKPFVNQPPTVVATSPEQQGIVQMDPQTGQISSQPNPNYAPKDPGQRTAHLIGLARQEQARLQGEVNAGRMTPDEALAQFNSWKSQVIDPQVQSLAAEQQSAQQAAQRQQQQLQQQALASESQYEAQRQQAAQQAANSAVDAARATLPYRVGPSFGADFSRALQTLSSGGGAVSFGPDAFTFQMPDFTKIAEEATAKALARISPYAAMRAQQPLPAPPAGFDVNAAMAGIGPVTFAPPPTP